MVAMNGAQPPERQRLRVLIVEDHVDTVVVMERLLRHWGHHVVTAQSCDEALSALDAGAPAIAAGGIDLVLGDVGLPDCDGVDLMRDLKGRLGCPVWVISGYGSNRDRARYTGAGLDGFLCKPIDAGDLRSTLDRIVPRGEA